MKKTTIEVGMIYRTPWDPEGLFLVKEIEPGTRGFRPLAFGAHVVDHPSGYCSGTDGRYFVHELRSLEGGNQ